MNVWEGLAATLGVVALAIAVVGLGWFVAFLAAYFRQRLGELRGPNPPCTECGHPAMRHPGDGRPFSNYCSGPGCTCNRLRSAILASAAVSA